MKTLLFVVQELLNISFVIFQVICKSEKWINIDTASDVGCLIGLNLLYEVNHEKEKESKKTQKKPLIQFLNKKKSYNLFCTMLKGCAM